MQNLGDEEKQDRVSRILRSMRGIETLVREISEPGLRRSIYAALRENLELVQVEDPTPDQMFFKVLASASMKVLSLKDTDRRFTDTVGLITEAVRLSVGATVVARDPIVPHPAPPPAQNVQSPPPLRQDPPSRVAAPAAVSSRPVEVPQKAVPAPAKTTAVVTSMSPALALFANLPPERRGGRRLDPLSLLLPGPARDGALTEMTDWISGKPWASDVLALRFAPTDPAAIEEIADLEAEGFSAPKTLKDRPGLRPFMETAGRERGISWLHGAGRDLGVYAITCEKAMVRFRETLERTIERYLPAQVSSLAAFGARLVPGEEVPDLLASAWDIEAFFLREAKDEDRRPAQDPRGSISPDRALHGGLVYERAAYLYLSSGLSLSSALMESLIEFRLAQVLEDLDASQSSKVQQAFDAVFFNDCARPIEDYKLQAGVMQAQPEPMPEF